MASPGRYKAVQSSDPRLEVKLSGKPHLCAGVAIERGERPGRLTDVWMWGRSRRCTVKIKKNEYYISNRILPDGIKSVLPGFDRFWPTCLTCAVETWPEAFAGPEISKLLPPMTPERRERVIRGLENIASEVRDMAIDDNGWDAEAS